MVRSTLGNKVGSSDIELNIGGLKFNSGSDGLLDWTIVGTVEGITYGTKEGLMEKNIDGFPERVIDLSLIHI